MACIEEVTKINAFESMGGKLPERTIQEVMLVLVR
jgi:hypothetical protein